MSDRWYLTQFSPLMRALLASSDGAPPDTTAPTVSSVSIEDDETDGTFVRVTFGEDIDPDSLVLGNISLTVNDVGRGISTPTWASASVLEIATDSPVYDGETCLLTLGAEAVEDLAGNPNELAEDIAIDNNSTRVFTPESLGPIISRVTGDSATMARAGSRVYSSLTDSGTLGGTWAAATNLHPVAVDLGEREVAQFRAGRRAQSSVAAASWDAFSNATGAASLSIIFQAYALGAAGYLWHGSTANSRGCNVRVDAAGMIDIDFANGTTTTTLADVGTVVAGTKHVVQLTKDVAGNITANLDDGTPVTGTFTPSNGAPAAAPQIGSNGTDHFFGAIYETVVHGVKLISGGLASMRWYLLAEWPGELGYSPLRDTTAADVAAWYHGSQIAVGAGVSDRYDESGHNNHQSEPTNQAALVADWESTGQPALQSDGVNDRIATTSTFTQGTIAQPVTHYLAVQANSQAVTRDLFDGAGTNRQIIRLSAVDGISVFSGGGSAPTVGITMPENERVILRCVMSSSQFNFRLVRDGRYDTISTTAASLGSGGLDGVRSFSQQTNTNFFNGETGEHIIFAGVAGAAVGESDMHDVALQEKYDVTPVFESLVVGEPLAAFALRRVVEGYDGPCMRVVRPSDSEPFDVGFATSDLGSTYDVDALETFLGSEVGQVSIGYDQTGNGLHSTQTTPSLRPELRIVVKWGTMRVLSLEGGRHLVRAAGLSVGRLASHLFTISDIHGSTQACTLGQLGTGAESSEMRVSPVASFTTQVLLTPYVSPSRKKCPQSRPMVYEMFFNGTAGYAYHGGEQLFTVASPDNDTMVGGYVGCTPDIGAHDKGWIMADIVFDRTLASGPRETYRAALETLFGINIAPTNATRLIFEGDSITTHGPADYGWIREATKVLSRPTHVYHVSKGSAKISEELANYANQVGDIIADYPSDDNIVFLAIGTNDITHDLKTGAQVWSDIQDYCALAKADGARVIVATILPDGNWDATKQGHWNDANTLIRAGEGVDFDLLCDFQANTSMGVFANTSDGDLYLDDLRHPDIGGHAVLGAYAATIIETML